jgi:polysaccharide biosynthesis protein PslH
MRILIVALKPPLRPYNGLQLVLASLLPYLRDMHEVEVLSLDGVHDGDRMDGLHLVKRPSGKGTDLRGALHLITGRPLWSGTFASALRQPLDQCISEFDPDIVHVFSGDLASLRTSLGDRPALLTALDAAHLNVQARAALRRGPGKQVLRLQERNVRRFIRAWYDRYDATVMVTGADADAIRDLAPGARVEVIPNGVHLDDFTTAGERQPGHVVLHGAMSYAPNVDAAVWAARDVMPRIREAVPDAQLTLVGRAPSREVRVLAELPGVAVTGEVEHVAPWLTGAAAYLCPMRSGTGIKNKLLEAMAASAPCVATPLALQGIDAVPGRDLLVGSDAESLAGHVITLLEDPDYASELGDHARNLVQRDHSWQAAAGRYIDLYAEITSR